MQYRVISADCHIDLPWLPADLLTNNAARCPPPPRHKLICGNAVKLYGFGG